LELFSGEQQNMIHGNSTKDHFCKCAETSSCTNVFGSNNVCNCDAKTPDWARDEVVTINKKHLPMTGLTYGPITEDWQTMKFSVGPLKCSGSPQFSGKKTIMKPFYIQDVPSASD
jgi:hypothetical protein